jgi:hypothetical protein
MPVSQTPRAVLCVGRSDSDIWAHNESDFRKWSHPEKPRDLTAMGIGPLVGIFLSSRIPGAEIQACRRPRELARGSKRNASKTPGPADSASLQTLATRLHDAVDNAKCLRWGPTALRVLSSNCKPSANAFLPAAVVSIPEPGKPLRANDYGWILGRRRIESVVQESAGRIVPALRKADSAHARREFFDARLNGPTGAHYELAVVEEISLPAGRSRGCGAILSAAPC